MPGFEPDGGSEEDTAAMEEEKNETEKKKGSFGMLREATLLADFHQTCPSKLPPQVSQEGLRNYIHSRLNDNLDPSFQTEDDGESVNFEYDDDHEEEESAELSIESEARNNPNGSFVMDLDVGSQYGANYLPNDITLPTINFEVDDPHAPQPPLHNIPNPDSSNYLLDRLSTTGNSCHHLSAPKWKLTFTSFVSQGWAHKGTKKEPNLFLSDPTTRSELFTQF
ncbi:unnamed protein product [Cylindrotheca closterium]|uniref:Uncharacterized protein n=1 Tax=Cylindrotheca closterium TaxID=2856 RepID=A0AAD2FJN6_9STRA|nr:unnamed protein product [Cylindrotheca closterium]